MKRRLVPVFASNFMPFVTDQRRRMLGATTTSTPAFHLDESLDATSTLPFFFRTLRCEHLSNFFYGSPLILLGGRHLRLDEFDTYFQCIRDPHDMPTLPVILISWDARHPRLFYSIRLYPFCFILCTCLPGALGSGTWHPG